MVKKLKICSRADGCEFRRNCPHQIIHVHNDACDSFCQYTHGKSGVCIAASHWDFNSVEDQVKFLFDLYAKFPDPDTRGACVRDMLALIKVKSEPAVHLHKYGMPDTSCYCNYGFPNRTRNWKIIKGDIAKVTCQKCLRIVGLQKIQSKGCHHD